MKEEPPGCNKRLHKPHGLFRDTHACYFHLGRINLFSIQFLGKLKIENIFEFLSHETSCIHGYIIHPTQGMFSG